VSLIIKTIVQPEEAGARIDRHVCGILSDASRTAVQRAIEDHAILVNGTPIAKNYKIRPGDAITGSLSEACNPDTLEPENIPVQVLYEDTHLVVINKPAGMVVHPGAGVKSGTLANALLYRWREEIAGVGDVSRPGMVHRLDKETSGIIIVAKNSVAHARLSRMFKERSVKKSYRTLVWGVPPPAGVINASLSRSSVHRKKIVVMSEGRSSLTRYEVRKSNNWMAELNVFPETGRTHQIRVHLSSIGHPVLGDDLYGGGRKYLDKVSPIYKPEAKKVSLLATRVMLHAEHIAFTHPVTGKRICLTSPLPEDMKKIISMV